MTTDRERQNWTGLGDRTEGPHFFRVWMPYLFQRVNVEGRKHAFLPLNRDYKPLGYMRREYVDYDEYALTHGVFFRRDPTTFVGIWHNVSGGAHYLYEDAVASRRDYFERLEKLMTKAMPLVALRSH